MPWETVADSEVLAVHAALMPTNQILYFGGNEYVRSNNADLTNFEKDVDKTRLFNLAPWKGDLVPGAPVTPLFEQSAGIFAALTVDEHGRMNVVWLDMNVPQPGLAGTGRLRGRPPEAGRSRHAAVPAEPWRVRRAHGRQARTHERRLARRERAQPGLARAGRLRGRSPEAGRSCDAAVPAEPWRIRRAHGRQARAHERRLARREPAQPGLAGAGRFRKRPLDAGCSHDAALPAEPWRIRGTDD